MEKNIKIVFFIPLLIILLVSLTTSKTTPNLVNVSHFPVPPAQVMPCDYQEITQLILQKMQNAQNLPGARIESKPTPIEEKKFLIYTQLNNQKNYYLYDIGNDKNWGTPDDRAIFISSISQNISTFNAMSSSLNSTNYLFYGFTTNSTSPNIEIYSCILSNSNCTNHSRVLRAPISNEYVLSEIMPYKTKNRLYFLIESIYAGDPGQIYSCSLIYSYDSCIGNNINTYNIIDTFSSNYPLQYKYPIYKDGGFIFESMNNNPPYQFFSLDNESINNLPRIGQKKTYFSKYIMGYFPVFMTFILNESNPDNFDLGLVDFSSNNIFSIRSGVNGTHLASNSITSGWYVLYYRTNPYRQYALNALNPLNEKEIYRTNQNMNNVPQPFMIQEDLSAVAYKTNQTSQNYQYFVSTCKAN